MNWIENLPAVSALFNAVTAVFLVSAIVAIRRGNKAKHRQYIFAALTSSAMFLACYLTFHYSEGFLNYQGKGLMRALFLAVLIPHTIMAVILLPLIVWALALALKGLSDQHRRVAPVAMGVWLFVSVTGVLLFTVFAPTLSN